MDGVDRRETPERAARNAELKRLRPEQVDEVARIIHDLARTGHGEAPPHPAAPARVVDRAVQHGLTPTLQTAGWDYAMDMRLGRWHGVVDYFRMRPSATAPDR